MSFDYLIPGLEKALEIIRNRLESLRSVGLPVSVAFVISHEEMVIHLLSAIKRIKNGEHPDSQTEIC